MARETPARAHLPKQSAGARGTRSPPAPTQSARCLGASAQLAAVHRTLRHGPSLQLQTAGVRPAAANRTGLPDRLKTGVEALSGFSLDDVRVHRNSPKPAALQALAYTQGSEIHVAPGQEAHLAHEAWHVVQQKQGRVKPTLQMKNGIAVNDDAGLEREADQMGARALAGAGQRREAPARPLEYGLAAPSQAAATPVQRRFADDWMPAAAALLARDNYQNDDNNNDQDLGTLAEAIAAYLSVPVGENFETFRQLAERADQINQAHDIVSNYVAAFDAIAGAPPPDAVARLQDLALRINEAYDLEAAAHNLEAEAPELAAPQDLEPDWPETLAQVPLLLARRLEQFRRSDQSKFDIWQKQLRTSYEKWQTPAQRNDNGKREIKTLVRLITALPLQNIEPEKEYDQRWKAEPMASDVEVSSSGFVVGATISLPLSDLSGKKKLRRRMTVSKARHMWDFLDADTNEPVNSLIAAKTDLESVAADMLELARDYKNRYLANDLGAAYEYTTKSLRVFRVNKTQNEYPHCFPIRGPDVVPMDMGVFNFHFGVKQSLATLAAGGFPGRARARELINLHEVGDEGAAVLKAMEQLKLPQSVRDTVQAGFEEEPEVSGDPHARLRGKGKKSKPRDPGETERRGWNQ